MNICILGATGSLGKALCHSLDSALGAQLNIAAVARTKSELRLLKEEIASVSHTAHLDVTKDMLMLEELAASLAPLDACVYTIGNSYQPTSHRAAVTPLNHRVMIDKIHYELEQHIIGLQMTFSCFLPYVKQGGSFIVIGSSMPSPVEGTCPDWLHAGHFASAKAGQRELVHWMRRDPLVRQKDISVRYLAPDSYEGHDHTEAHGYIPTVLHSIEHLTESIIDLVTPSTQYDTHDTSPVFAV